MPGANVYVNAAANLADALAKHQPKATEYGHQLIPGKEERQPAFLTEDSYCDCSKFVLKTMLNAERVDYNTGTYVGIKVAAFGDAKVSDISSVEGIKQAIAKMQASGEAAAIRAGDAIPGDLMLWTGHVAMVTAVGGDHTKPLLSFAMMGNSGAHVYSNIPLAKIQENTGSSHFGSGRWEGFWTPKYKA